MIHQLSLLLYICLYILSIFNVYYMLGKYFYRFIEGHKVDQL